MGLKKFYHEKLPVLLVTNKKPPDDTKRYIILEGKGKVVQKAKEK